MNELITLLPEDTPQIFHQKMIRLSEARLREEILRFEGYEKFAKILRFHQALLKRPDVNIRVLYNDTNGFHLSSCDKCVSNTILPNEKKILCTCDDDFNNVENFFRKVLRDTFYRCKLCKRYTPDWEVIDRNDEPNKEVSDASDETDDEREKLK